MTKQLNLFDKVNQKFEIETSPQTTQPEKKIPKYKRLTKAYEVITNFNRIPQFRAYQEQLIRIYYKNLKKGKDTTQRLKQLRENQIRSTATDFFNKAYKIWNSKTSEERAIIKNLFLLEKELEKEKSKKDKDPAEVLVLDERVCIQLEAFPDDSDLVQEYNVIKGYQ